jgi:hypothetical protein
MPKVYFYTHSQPQRIIPDISNIFKTFDSAQQEVRDKVVKKYPNLKEVDKGYWEYENGAQWVYIMERDMEK